MVRAQQSAQMLSQSKIAILGWRTPGGDLFSQIGSFRRSVCKGLAAPADRVLACERQPDSTIDVKLCNFWNNRNKMKNETVLFGRQMILEDILFIQIGI